MSVELLRAWCLFSIITLLFFSITAVTVLGQSEHAVSFEDLGTLKSADYLQLSPDGKDLAYTIDGDLWLTSTDRGSSGTKLGKGTVPMWSPDGKRLAYYSSQSGTFQLWMRNMQSGSIEQLTHLDGGINPDPAALAVGSGTDPFLYRWSPDGTRLVFTSRALTTRQPKEDDKEQPVTSLPDTAEAPLVLTGSTPPEWTLNGIFRVGGFDGPPVNGTFDSNSLPKRPSPPKVSQLFIVDFNAKKVVQLTNDENTYFTPTWSPDGLTIVCVSTEGRSLAGYGPDTTNIYAIDVASGSKRVLTKGLGQKKLPSWSPDGKWIAYFGGEKFKKLSVFIVPSKRGEVLNVTSTLDRHVFEFAWSADSKSIVVLYLDGVTSSVARVDLRTGELQQISGSEPAVRRGVTISQTGTIAWQQSDGSTQGVIVVLPPGRRAPYVLVDLNPQLQEWRLGAQEVIRWKNSQGNEMAGILVKPVGYQPGHRYPLIVDAYPAQGNYFKGSAMMGNQSWASRGYAVFWPNARAPHTWVIPFRSKAFNEAGKGPGGVRVTVDDVTSGVEELIRRGIVDPERMGLYGFSNGGGIVNQLITRTHRFKCAVSVAAATSADWSVPFFFMTMNPAIPQIAGVTPWKNPEAYIQLSVVYRLDRVNTPVLLADGDNDSYFLLGEIEMYNGLRYLRKDVTFIRYPGQGHGFTGWAMKDFCQRENAFFDKYLKPTQPSE